MNRKKKRRLKVLLQFLEEVMAAHRTPGPPDLPARVLSSQQARFSLISSFGSKVKGICSIGFRYSYKKDYGFASFMAANMKFIREDANHNFYIDYPNIKLSRGGLCYDVHDELVLTEHGIGKLERDTGNYMEDEADDKLYVLIYNSTSQKVLYSDSPCKRSEETVYLHLGEVPRGDELHCWTFLHSPTQKRNSRSLYVPCKDLR